MRLAYRTETGRVRHRNEDAFLVPAPEVPAPDTGSTSGTTGQWVLAVSDGMGGHPAGDVASEITVRTLASALRQDVTAQSLVEALHAAHVAILDAAAADPTTEGMGATAVVAVLDAAGAMVAHVGDSRAYLVRDSVARQLTADHGEGGYLSQVLGHGQPAPDLARVNLAPGDRLLLCTDGLNGLVDDEEIGRLAADADVELACDRLVSAALDAGGHDNVTVVLVAV